MHRWIKKAKVVLGSAALVVALFGASLVPGVAYVPSAEAATSYDSVMQADSASGIDAKRGGKKDKGDMGPSGRRSRFS